MSSKQRAIHNLNNKTNKLHHAALSDQSDRDREDNQQLSKKQELQINLGHYPNLSSEVLFSEIAEYLFLLQKKPIPANIEPV